MMVLSDYPDKIIAEHQLRIEKFTIMSAILLVIFGGWWLFINLDSDKNLVFRYGPVIIMFISAIILPDLINFGPKSRAKIASISNILWPCILAFIGVNYDNSPNFLSILLLLLLIIILFLVSYSILGSNLATRRLRGITSIGGLAIASPILSSTSNILPWAVVITATSLTMIPDLLKKDSDHLLRKRFSKELDIAELKLLEFKAKGINIQQASSILKVAREEGFDNPEEGLKSIDDSLMDAQRFIALSKDIEEIRNNAYSRLEKLELITLVPKIPRELFNQGDTEFDAGSLREAELLYRKSKEKSTELEKYWQEASDLIDRSESMINDFQGYQIKGVIGILNSAKDALMDENPKKAKEIAESIEYHISSISSNEESAILVIKQVEENIENQGFDLATNSKNRLNEAKDALNSGNSTLAKGLADSILREIKLTSESMLKVQKALRQKSIIESRFPSGKLRNKWLEKLHNIIAESNSGNWIEASDNLEDLTKLLRDFENESNEAKELLIFMREEWEILRPKLDSFGIKPDDEMRMMIEREVSDANISFEDGDIQLCLSHLSKSDELIENLRRRI